MSGLALSPAISAGIRPVNKSTLHPKSSRSIGRKSASRSVTSVSIMDTGYVLADAVSKVADKASAQVGSVDAPGWVLPVAAIGVAVALSASGFLLKPGIAQTTLCFEDESALS